MEGKNFHREIEEHSLQWLDLALDSKKRLLCSAIESNIFSQLYLSKGMIYEAIYSQLTFLRTILSQLYTADNQDDVNQLRSLYFQAIPNLKRS